MPRIQREPPDANPIESYALRVSPKPMWRVLECLMQAEEMSSSAIRGAIGIGRSHSAAVRFANLMTFLRDNRVVLCRRPAFPGELGEPTTITSPWIYRISNLGRQLMAARDARYGRVKKP